MNPLLSEKRGAYETPLFKEYQTKDFLPALEEAISLARKRLEEIKKEKNPNFTNIIEAFEKIDKEASYVNTIYYNLFSAHASEEHQALAPKIAKINSEFMNDISLDEDLFLQVNKIYQQRESLDLNKEEAMLLKNTYKFFARNGANLDKDKKEELRKIDADLAPLSSKFEENVLKSTNSFELFIKKEDTEGLPDSFLESAAEAAKEKGKKGEYLLTLNAPSLIPFLTYSKRRDLREKVWRAYNTQCIEGPFSNKEIIKQKVELMHKRASLLGYNSYADYVLEERMAKTVNKVEDFLANLFTVSKKAALKDVEEVSAYAKKRDGIDELMPWDFGYYSEKLKEEKFGFSEQDLKPYFSIDKVVNGAFQLASQLYQVEFKSTKEIDVYHPDVKTFEVIDLKTKEVVGIFYTDFHPRETKKSGAWMTSYREQHIEDGKNKIPQISIVCNFTKPTSTKPSLLTFNEVETLFHEFGHALHGLLSNVKYESLSGTSVLWDFVELPSQFMENFLYEKEVLDTFAEHYESGKKIPEDLVNKLKASSKFLAGYSSLRQLNFAYLDMAWYKDRSGLDKDVLDFENEVTKKTNVLPKVEGTSRSVSFSHIFAGGYSAGYYSYKWAEVLDADAYEAFKEEGLFNKELAKRFKENILSRGGSEEPMELYKRFRGREPDPKALLRRDGLL